MDFDVVVVGAGPAGLAAAIRLKQLQPDLAVVVVEKGSEVGAHILSGAVDRPRRARHARCPTGAGCRPAADHRVTDDRFYYLGPAGGVRLPNVLMPKLMSNHGNFVGSLGNVARYLGRKAEALGVDIYPGFAAVEVLYGEAGEVVGVATGDMGVGKDGAITDGFTRGMELRAKYVLVAEGARGSLAKGLIARFKLDAGRDPQKYGIGLKELWQVAGRDAPARARAAFLRLAARQRAPAAAPSSTTWRTTWSAVGFVVHLNYSNPTLSPFDEFQRFKTHPMIAETFAGGKRLVLRGARHHRGRLAVGAEAGLPGRRADRLRGGLRQRAAHQGIAQRHPLRHAGGRACRPRRSPRAAPTTTLPAYEDAWRVVGDRRRTSSACATSSRCGRSFGTALGVRARRPRHVDAPALRRLALRHAEPRQARLRDA